MAFVMGTRMIGAILLAAMVASQGDGVVFNHDAQPTSTSEIEKWSSMVGNLAGPMPKVMQEMIRRGMISRLEDYKYEAPQHIRSCTLLYEPSSRCSSTPMLFFHEAAARNGNTLPMYFEPAATAKLGFLQRRVARRIPFTSSKISEILELFHIPPDSTEAADVAATLRLCGAAPGDKVVCVTSPEDLVGRAAAMLGTAHIQALASAVPTAGVSLQPYTVRAVKPVDGSDFVGCHPELYPYTVYRCHMSGQTRAYVLEMESSNGNQGFLNMVAVCHQNTSSWDPEHVAFKVLASKPGGRPICHFVPYGHVTFGKRVPHAYGV